MVEYTLSDNFPETFCHLLPWQMARKSEKRIRERGPDILTPSSLPDVGFIWPIPACTGHSSIEEPLFPHRKILNLPLVFAITFFHFSFVSLVPSLFSSKLMSAEGLKVAVCGWDMSLKTFMLKCWAIFNCTSTQKKIDTAIKFQTNCMPLTGKVFGVLLHVVLDTNYFRVE